MLDANLAKVSRARISNIKDPSLNEMFHRRYRYPAVGYQVDSTFSKLVFEETRRICEQFCRPQIALHPHA